MALVGLLAGCARREPPLVNPGISTANRLAPGLAVEEGGVVALPARPEELENTSVVGRPFASRGHFARRWKAEVSVNAVASPVYEKLAPSTRFALGSVIVETHVDGDSGAPGPVFAMAKRDQGFFPEGGDWEFIVADSGGRLEDRGKLALCARCHAEAVADWVFGLPPEAR